MFLMRLISEGGGGPNTELLWILEILLGLFALVILVGWWEGSRKPNPPKAESEPRPVVVMEDVESGKVENQKRSVRAGRKKK